MVSSPSDRSCCWCRMSPVCQDSQRSGQEIPLPTTSSPAAFHTTRVHYTQDHRTSSHKNNTLHSCLEVSPLKIKKITAFDTDPCRHLKWGPVRPLARAWRYPWFRWAAWRCTDDRCCSRAHGAKKQHEKPALAKGITRKATNYWLNRTLPE